MLTFSDKSILYVSPLKTDGTLLVLSQDSRLDGGPLRGEEGDHFLNCDYSAIITAPEYKMLHTKTISKT